METITQRRIALTVLLVVSVIAGATVVVTTTATRTTLLGAGQDEPGVSSLGDRDLAAIESPDGGDDAGGDGPNVVGQPANDMDGDGKFEDVNGNGGFDFVDVVTLLDNFNADPVQENTDAFDFNDSGQVDFVDVVALLDEL